MNQRKIIHVDMDCFYAAVEVKYNPRLRGLPLGIGGPPQSRSVLCTASYEARKFGVRAAMPSSQAVRLCPQLVLIPPNFDLYIKESRAVHEIFRRFTSVVQPLSLDEAYLDVTGSSLHGGSATRIAQEIRQLIQHETQLTASAGIAENKFLAKVASDWNKPNGQFALPPSHVAAFMKELKVEKIPGVGKVTAKKMHELGLQTCGDIQKQKPLQLAQWFGSRAPDLLDLAHGIDLRPVEARAERKSLTVEETFNTDLAHWLDWMSRLPNLYEDWEQRMRRHQEKRSQEKIRGFVVKVKYFDFKNTTHEISSRGWPSLSDFEELLQYIWDKRSDPVRLIGIGVRLAAEEIPEQRPQLSFSL